MPIHRRAIFTLTLALVAILIVAGCGPAPAVSTATPAEAPTEVPPEEPKAAPVPATVTPTTVPSEVPAETPGIAPTNTPAGPPRIGLQLVVEGLASPVDLITPEDGSGRLFIVDRIGVIKILTPEGALIEEPFLDIRDRMVGLQARYDERGLLGLAFHPRFEDNGRLFVYYSAPLRQGAPSGWNHTSHVSEFRVAREDADRANPASERIVLEVDQPQGNHNGGQIAFGPDGYLYIALGDGGAANDVGLGHPPMGNGQDLSTLLGSILRIDVDGGDPYGIPSDNPLVGREGRDEIFAYGLRNPFRMSFDAVGNHELFVGDVGQNLWEEVDIVFKGGNYGWNIREGTRCFDANNPDVSPAECPETDANGEPLIDPIIEYGHPSLPSGIGTSVIGGFVYRGSEIPQLQGRYIFGDWSTRFDRPDGRLHVASPPSSGAGMWTMEELSIATSEDGTLAAFVLAFGQDAERELYVLTTEALGPTGNTGKVWKIVPAP